MYLGGYLNNKKHGKGTLLFKNNDRYEGDFQNDYMHGKGILKLCNGDVYEGMCIVYTHAYIHYVNMYICICRDVYICTYIHIHHIMLTKMNVWYRKFYQRSKEGYRKD